ncbi:MAG: nucleotidyl transferase AbiEii/AbiGii toxin family protein [Candidatus Gribaldobacteria bacterium]|nr:nucleotidyl transferase AbiEii/AbiGii toxin family protein [Candidatus Gribaldobacteria bacterium]
MSEQISTILKRKLNDLSAYGEIDAETRRNALKEELQFFVLNFIYHHPEYNKWIMYGGSALRIIHGLDRMSVDLDFEVSHAITEKFLEELKKEVEDYFINTYGVDADFLTIKITTGRGLILKFHVGEELSIGNASNQVHAKIDLNHFIAPKTVTERRPINRDQLSFVILTYNMGALMASKLAAIFLRGTRGVGDIVYEEKGRDIYDLLWYMGKKVMPDFDYLTAKGIDINNPKALFDKITIKILNNPQTDANLKQDLTPLFLNQTYIENWLKNWRESYLRLLDEYKIHTITTLKEVVISEDFSTDNFSFTYTYNTEDKKIVRIRYTISDYWIDFTKDGDISVLIDNRISDITKFANDGANTIPASQQKKLKQYDTLFHQKNERYFKKTNNVMLGDSIVTKVIRMTADNLNPKEQIVLNKSALFACELDDLLK